MSRAADGAKAQKDVFSCYRSCYQATVVTRCVEARLDGPRRPPSLVVGRINCLEIYTIITKARGRTGLADADAAAAARADADAEDADTVIAGDDPSRSLSDVLGATDRLGLGPDAAAKSDMRLGLRASLPLAGELIGLSTATGAGVRGADLLFLTFSAAKCVLAGFNGRLARLETRLMFNLEEAFATPPGYEY